MNFDFSNKIDFNILNKDKITQIHRATIDILCNYGVKIDDSEIVDKLTSNGANIKKDNICIPEEMVEKALKSSPDIISLYNRFGEKCIELGKNSIYFGTHADMLEIIDPVTNEIRNFKREDTELMTKVAEFLPNISFILAVGLQSNVPEKIQSQIALLDVLRNFSKVINFSSNDIQGLKDQIELISLVAGGLENFRKKPFAFYYCEPIPPLYHPKDSTEKLKLVANSGIPCVYMPYSMLGGTAPVTFAGALTQCNAEVLSGLVIIQLINKGAPMIYGAMPSVFDMKTTIGSYGAPEFHMLVAASAELADYYGLPFYGTAGVTDAKVIDEQAVSEGTMSCFSAMLSKADLVHDIGIMDHCNSLSPEMLVLYNEIIDMLSVYRKGVKVNSDELAIDVIKEVGASGHYLTHDHTYNNFKKIWYSDIFRRDMEGSDNSLIRKKIKEKIKEIKNEFRVDLNDNYIDKELNKFEKELFKKVNKS